MLPVILREMIAASHDPWKLARDACGGGRRWVFGASLRAHYSGLNWRAIMAIRYPERTGFRRAFLGGAVAALLFSIGASAGQLPGDDRPSMTARSSAPAPVRAAPGPAADPLTITSRTAAPDADGRYLTIVRFTGQSLASYDGGVPGLAATTPRATGAARLDARSPEALAYIQHLEQQQAAHAAAISRLLGRRIELEHQYLGALNGAAVRLTLEEARLVRDLAFVVGVHLDELRELQTDVGPEHIGAPSIWNGQTTDLVATRGEGIIVGVIDTGINFSHPSFAATDADGYAHTNPYGAGVYLGWCATNPGFCNEKVIAAYGFNPVGGNPTDDNNHGSHVASTAAGNKHVADFDVGGDNYQLEISGVAPRANIVAYRVCAPSCPNTASMMAIESAILTDQVDVLNYSISGNDFPWDDPVDLAFLDAFNAGIFVAASAGNAGPGASTVAKTGPWNASVAASTHRRAIGNTLDVTGPGSPAALQQVLAVPGEGTLIASDITGTLRFNEANPLGCTAHPSGFFTGTIALVSRGGCNFSVKVNNAVAAGATEVVVFNSVGGSAIVMGGLSGTPAAVMIDNQSGGALRDYVLANPGTTIRVNAGTSLVENTDWEDIIAGFSSRGPSQYDLLAPTFTAPGVNILAAGFDGADAYAFLQGTSMASPHAAGAAALVKALRPSWSPAEIRSALALTAVSDVLAKEDGLTAADPFDQGSGLLNLAALGHAGLVMNETGANFLAANPALGGDPRSLNIPHLVDQNCQGACSFQRTFRSVFPITVDYLVEASAPTGINVTVTPSDFSLGAGASISLTFEVSVDEGVALIDDWNFGEVRILPQSFTPAPTSLPLAVIPRLSLPQIDVIPGSVTAVSPLGSGPVEVAVEIHNLGGEDLVWQIEEGAAVDVAIWDQPVNGTGGIVSDFFIGSDAGAYSASDFLLQHETGITRIFAAGFDNTNTLATQPAINWHVYADAGGVPAGHPEDGTAGASALWTYSAATNAAGVDITDNNITLALPAAGQTLNLPAGTYWLSVFPSYDVTGAGGARWNWYQAAQVGAPTQLISPDVFGVANWTSLSALGVTFSDTAFTLTASETCGGSWMSSNTSSGSVGTVDFEEIILTLDPSGLPPGSHTAFLCISSNDPDNAMTVVPVTLVVDYLFSDRFETP
jgi:subtilisin family serine protease